jgi:aminoglycoside phosphotransferase (APT) family kinase protein
VLPGPDECCRRLLAASPDDVKPLIVWDDRATYRVRIGNDEFVLKADANEGELGNEAAGHLHAAANGIPVPELLVVEPDALAMRFVNGVPLTGKSSDAAWRAAAAVVEQIHAAPPIGKLGGGFTHYLEHELEYAVARGLKPERAENIRGAMSAALPLPPIKWLHGDLQPDHFILSGNDVVAVLDWSDHGRGDALWDYTVLTFDDPSKLALVVDEPANEFPLRLLRTHRLLTDVRWLTEHGMQDAANKALAELNGN